MSIAPSTLRTTRTRLNVQSFPRPPRLEKISRHILIKLAGSPDAPPIAETNSAYWVLETHHPPTYYISPSAFRCALQKNTQHTSYCEWKGRATYWSLTFSTAKDSSAADSTVKDRAWSYEDPTSSFKDIQGYISVYANGVPWECFVDGEKVQAQDGDFYGGWVTSEIEGRTKGGAGTWGW